MRHAPGSLPLGLLLVAASTVLLLWFRDAELWIFHGRPLGVVLGILGLLDLIEWGRARRLAGRTTSSGHTVD